MALLVSLRSASKLRQLMRLAPTTPIQAAHGNEFGRAPLMVRCTSATAAGTGISAECYPAVVVDTVSDELIADQPELGEVWLTLVNGSTPVVNDIYFGVMAGEHTEGSDTRPRVFVMEPSSVAFPTASITARYLGADYTITAADAWETVNDGSDMTLTLAAGTYLFFGHIHVEIGGAGVASILTRLRNTTDSLTLPASGIVCGTTPSTTLQPMATLITTYVVLTSSKTIALQARAEGSTPSPKKILRKSTVSPPSVDDFHTHIKALKLY